MIRCAVHRHNELWHPADRWVDRVRELPVAISDAYLGRYCGARVSAEQHKDEETKWNDGYFARVHDGCNKIILLNCRVRVLYFGSKAKINVTSNYHVMCSRFLPFKHEHGLSTSLSCQSEVIYQNSHATDSYKRAGITSCICTDINVMAPINNLWKTIGMILRTVPFDSIVCIRTES